MQFLENDVEHVIAAGDSIEVVINLYNCLTNTLISRERIYKEELKVTVYFK